MEEVVRRVDAAYWRMLARQFAGRLGRCLAVTLAIALPAVIAPKVWPLPMLPAGWGVAWLVGAVVAGLLAAAVWTWRRPKSRLDAAVEIDRRFDLRERIASSLTLTEADLASEAGAALARDAQRAVAKVEVAERFRLGLDRGVWRPLVPGLVALLTVTLFSNRTATATAEKPPTAAVAEEEEEEAKKAAAEARKQLARKRKQAEKEGLADATALLKKVEEGTADLADKGAKSPTQAAVKLNDLSRQLAERREKLGGGEELRNQLNRMKDLGGGPADKAAEAMKQGDWQRAVEEVAKLREEIASGKASPEAKEKLAQQLGKMQQQLAEAAQQQAAQKEELARQLADAQRKGDLQQAGKLQQKLDEMAMKAPQIEALEKLAQQMGQAQEALDKGDAQQAAEAMQQMAQQMGEMAREDQEMQMLDAALTDIQDAKQAMGMEPGDKPGQQPGQGQQQNAQAGGSQPGKGSGESAQDQGKVAYRDSQVKQEIEKGASTFGGLVKGPSVKGEVAESIKTPLDAAAAQPADPLTSERLPRSRREHAEDYFRALREKL